MAPVLVRDGVRRNGFLATLGSRTWRARAVAACALADLEAVSSRGAYAAWLRRTARAWERLPVPDDALAWPLVSVEPQCLLGRAALAADLADLTDLTDLADGAGPVDAGHLADAADLLGAGDPLGAADLAAVESAPTDEAFLVGAAHVAVVAACDAAVLTPAALALAAAGALPLGTRFLQECRRLAGARTAIRRELAAWAADQHPETAERAVLTAQALSLELAEALRP